MLSIICRNLIGKGFKTSINGVGSIALVNRNYSTHALTDEEFDEKYISYFNKKDIDCWEVRHGINDLIATLENGIYYATSSIIVVRLKNKRLETYYFMHSDVVPEPKIIVSVLRACRRLNDFALTIRFLEAVKYKCGTKVGEIYPYIIQEITPVLKELGISTPEELGYDHPEFLLEHPEYE